MTVDWQIASLGWDDFPRIDLNFQRREEQRRVFLRARRKGLMVICVAVYAAAILAPSTMSIFGLRGEANGLAGQITATESKIQSVQQLAGALDAKQQQWRQYQAQQRERRSWGDTFSTIAATCPSNVYLDNLQVDADSGAVTIMGSCGSAEYLNAFVTRMQNSSAFQNVTLSETTTDPTLPSQQLRFKIDATCSLPLGST